MLHIKTKDATHQVIGFNIVNRNSEEDSYELWITRPGNKGLLIKTGKKEEIEELKEALDFAVENDVKLFEIT